MGPLHQPRTQQAPCFSLESKRSTQRAHACMRPAQVAAPPAPQQLTKCSSTSHSPLSTWRYFQSIPQSGGTKKGKQQQRQSRGTRQCSWRAVGWGTACCRGACCGYMHSTAAAAPSASGPAAQRCTAAACSSQARRRAPTRDGLAPCREALLLALPPAGGRGTGSSAVRTSGVGQLSGQRQQAASRTAAPAALSTGTLGHPPALARTTSRWWRPAPRPAG